MPSICPACHQLMGQERDGRFWKHGSKVYGKVRLVVCPMSGRKPEREYEQLEMRLEDA